VGTTEGPRADFSIVDVTDSILQPTNKEIILSPVPSITLVKADDFTYSLLIEFRTLENRVVCMGL
jgi:hypothetical protein